MMNNKKRKENTKMKSLETVGRVTHTHTHTQVVLDNQIARNSKVFRVPKNGKNLEHSCHDTVIF